MPIINTNLEREFNLAPASKNEEVQSTTTDLIITENLSVEKSKSLDKIDQALPRVEGLESTDTELDEIAQETMKAYKDLLELSMNVEERFMGEIATAAANMIGHSLNARTNKVKKKLELIRLQIKKQVADQKGPPNLDNAQEIEGGSEIVDRNELLRRCKETKTIEGT